MKTYGYFIFAAAMAGLVSAAPARAEGELGELSRLNSGTEAKIQAQVLDSILGPGRAFVFLEMKAQVKTTAEEESKSGVGELHTAKSQETEAAATGKEDMKKAGKDKKAGSMQEQTARQVKNSSEAETVYELAIDHMSVRILHNADVSPDKLKAVKDALLALYPGNIKPEDILFVPAAFAVR